MDQNRGALTRCRPTVVLRIPVPAPSLAARFPLSTRGARIAILLDFFFVVVGKLAALFYIDVGDIACKTREDFFEIIRIHQIIFWQTFGRIVGGSTGRPAFAIIPLF
jgi:hypothetical protein